MSITSIGLGNTERRVLRLNDVVAKTRLSKSTIRRLELRGEFPARLRLSFNAVGWRLDQIDEWISAREAVRFGGEDDAG